MSDLSNKLMRLGANPGDSGAYGGYAARHSRIAAYLDQLAQNNHYPDERYIEQGYPLRYVELPHNISALFAHADEQVETKYASAFGSMNDYQALFDTVWALYEAPPTLFSFYGTSQVGAICRKNSKTYYRSGTHGAWHQIELKFNYPYAGQATFALRTECPRYIPIKLISVDPGVAGYVRPANEYWTFTAYNPNLNRFFETEIEFEAYAAADGFTNLFGTFKAKPAQFDLYDPDGGSYSIPFVPLQRSQVLQLFWRWVGNPQSANYRNFGSYISPDVYVTNWPE